MTDVLFRFLNKVNITPSDTTPYVVSIIFVERQ